MSMVSPSDHVSTIRVAFHPAAIAATSSAAPGVPSFSHYTKKINRKSTLEIVNKWLKRAKIKHLHLEISNGFLKKCKNQIFRKLRNMMNGRYDFYRFNGVDVSL